MQTTLGIEMARKHRRHLLVYCVEGSVYLTATVLALIGLYLLSTVWAMRDSNDWWLGWHDPLLGINNRLMLILGGILHIGLSAYLFASRNFSFRNLAILWLGLNHLVYYSGAILMDSSALLNTERFLGWRLHVPPTTVAAWWKILLVYLIIVSLGSLYLTWSPAKDGRSQKMFKAKTEMEPQQQIEKPVTRLNSETTSDYTKNVCPHCGQKIAFPLSRLEESIACPHCAARITLREAPMRMV
jgi:DNA-directed RNA polymerase subunit RPC12/RpoP